MTQVPGLPIGYETAYGQNPPLCTQFSVFLDNRVGKLNELIEIFDGEAIRLVSIAVIDSSDYAVVRLVTTRARLARRLLNEVDLPFTEAEILVVELDEHQRLTKLSLSLLAAEINISYIYPLMVRVHGAATVAIHCDDQILAGQVLRRKGFHLLNEQQLRDAAGGDPPLT